MGAPAALVRAVEGGHHGVPAQVVDVAGHRALGHLQRREVLAVPGIAVDLGVGPVGHVDALRAPRDREAVPGAELSGRRAPAGEGEVVPGDLEGAGARHPRGEDLVEGRVAGGHVEEAVQVLDVGGSKRAPSREEVPGRGRAEVVVLGGTREGVHELAREGGGEDAPLVVAGEAQVRRAVRGGPDLRVVLVRVLHLRRGGQEHHLLEVGAQAEDAGPGQEEVGLAPASR